MICPFSNQTCTYECPLALQGDSSFACGVSVASLAIEEISESLYNIKNVSLYNAGLIDAWPRTDIRFYETNEFVYPDPEEDASRPEGTRGQDGPDATGATNGDGTRGGEAK